MCEYSWRVPSTTFGKLKIVPSANLDEVGPQKGEAVNFDWKWSYSAPGFVIWLALILALILPKANHNPRILLIFVPLVIAYLFWLALKKVTSMPSSSAAQFDTVFQSLALGIAVLWLVMNYFNRFGGFVKFLLSFVILVAVAGLSTLSYSTDFSNETVLFLALSAFQAITLLSATTAAGKLCSWRYRPTRFMLWLAVWMLLCSLITMFGFFIVGNAIMSSGPGPDILQTILMLTLIGLLFGLCLYVLNLPFMFLAFCSPFFRERFYACLRLKSMPITIASPKTNTSTDGEIPG